MGYAKPKIIGFTRLRQKAPRFIVGMLAKKRSLAFSGNGEASLAEVPTIVGTKAGLSGFGEVSPFSLFGKPRDLSRGGFTIAELMVAASIALMAFAVLFYISFTIQDDIGITSSVLGISEKGRLAIDRISKDTRKAKSVISSYGSYTSGNTTLILRIPSIDINGDIIDPKTYFDTIIYTLDPGNPERLLYIVNANAVSSRNNATEIVTQNVNTLLFSSNGVGLSSITDTASIITVTVKIITSTTALAGSPRLNKITTSISLRNKSKGL